LQNVERVEPRIGLPRGLRLTIDYDNAESSGVLYADDEEVIQKLEPILMRCIGLELSQIGALEVELMASPSPPSYRPPSREQPDRGQRRIVISSRKSSGLAALLSFFCCGLGQIYNGQILTGVALMIGYSVCLGVGYLLAIRETVVAAGATNPNAHAGGGVAAIIGALLVFAAVALSLYSMINAYRGAQFMTEKAKEGSHPSNPGRE
jgi:TM2 domain-containing membrane protein YozV